VAVGRTLTPSARYPTYGMVPDMVRRVGSVLSDSITLERIGLAIRADWPAKCYHSCRADIVKNPGEGPMRPKSWAGTAAYMAVAPSAPACAKTGIPPGRRRRGRP